MHATLPLLRDSDFPAINRDPLKILQVNLGYRCNQSCLHCHVNAGPERKEMMSKETMDDIIAFLEAGTVTQLDLTGGAPELNPHFRYLVRTARELGIHVMDRCNLTILEEEDEQDLADFLATNKVEINASMPCYLKDNVDGQRGKGVYDTSIQAIKKLNRLGYGKNGTGLVLNLVYNPTGPYLPPGQADLEADYRRELGENFGVSFNQLFTIANMPIQRFGSTLISKGQFYQYMNLLKDSHQDGNLQTVMCRELISIDWQGYVYDCDFNQMLGLPLIAEGHPKPHISKLIAKDLRGNPIVVADHCYGCTAGQGSSCGGAMN
ncbi:MAG: arsenosugar biosynthesis radical SAM (seleno)protein ArsS [Acidiferrobacterales bacterium]